MLRYTEDHEWINLEGDTGSVGGSRHTLSNSLAILSLLKLPEERCRHRCQG